MDSITFKEPFNEACTLVATTFIEEPAASAFVPDANAFDPDAKPSSFIVSLVAYEMASSI